MGKKSRAGRIWNAAFDLLLLAAVICMLSLIAAPVFHASQVKADLRLVTVEARALYGAFDAYYEQHRSFPNCYVQPSLAADTLDPLRKRGYYRGHLTRFLMNHRIDAYDSPDDRGLNREFWVEMTLKNDHSIRFLVARSDDAPMGGGLWRDGVYVLKGGVLERL
jgi:type II secretory pathway pseudopilin PulG